MGKDDELFQEIRMLQSQVDSLSNNVCKLDFTASIPQAVFDKYNKIINTLISSNHLSRYFEIEPTGHGTWMVIEKHQPGRGTKTILRDPKGEYSYCSKSSDRNIKR